MTLKAAIQNLSTVEEGDNRYMEQSFTFSNEDLISKFNPQKVTKVSTFWKSMLIGIGYDPSKITITRINVLKKKECGTTTFRVKFIY